MARGWLFVLCDSPDETYASALAAELGGVPIRCEPSALQFGANTVCVEIGRNLPTMAATKAEFVLRCAKGGSSVCSSDTAVLIEASGDAAVDADAIRPHVAALNTESAAKGHHLRGRTPSLSAAFSSGGPARSLVLRSAVGVVAVLVLAGVVGPFILQRAQASGAAPAAISAPTDTLEGVVREANFGVTGPAGTVGSLVGSDGAMESAEQRAALVEGLRNSRTNEPASLVSIEAAPALSEETAVAD